jgi:putative transposase
MLTSRFTTEQIGGFLKEQEAGARVSDICRRVGISDNTFHRWKRKYGGVGGPPRQKAQAARGEPRPEADRGRQWEDGVALPHSRRVCRGCLRCGRQVRSRSRRESIALSEIRCASGRAVHLPRTKAVHSTRGTAATSRRG